MAGYAAGKQAAAGYASYGIYHGLKNNTRLTRFINPTKKRTFDDVIASLQMAVFQCCVWLIAEMRSSRAVFNLNYRQYGVNRYLWFYKFPKNSEMCRVGCVF